MSISISNAVLKRGRREDVFSLTIESFNLGEGEFVSLLGPSGSGKSTMLDLLGLVLKPVAADTFTLEFRGGEVFTNVHLRGNAELMRVRRRHFGYILQSGGLIGSMNVRDNIMLAARFSDKKFNRENFDRILELLQIGNLLGRKPRELSGGQRQRVAIARAMVHNPDVVLADEPTAAIDHKLANEVCGMLHHAAKEVGCSIVMVTHDRELVKSYSDRIIELA